MAWAGMKSVNGELDNEDNTLSCLEDEKNYSFEQIADVIEKEWETL